MTLPATVPPASRQRRHRGPRALASLLIASLAFTGISLVTVSPATVTAASAAATPTITVGTARTLTLPAGDGFNDTSTVRIASTSALTVRVDVIERSSKRVVGTLATALRLKKDGSRYRASVGLSAEKFETNGIGENGDGTGRYYVRARGTTTSAADASPFWVGSGAITKLGLSTTESTLYPYPDDYRETLHAKVTAKDESGTILPISGLLRVISGAERRDAAIDTKSSAPATVKVLVDELPLGKGSVKVQVSGPAGDAVTSKGVPLTFAATRVTTLAVSPTTPYVYPARDGYADSVGVRFSTTTSTGKALAVKGLVTISRNGKAVKKWTVKSSKNQVLEWDGRVGGRIVAGTYDIDAEVRSSEGALVRASGTIKVSDKKLVDTTVSVWRDADEILEKFTPYDARKKGACAAKSGAYSCTGYDVARDSQLSLYAWGSVGVPSAARSSAKYETPTMRIVAVAPSVTGVVYWAYGHRSLTGPLQEGRHSLSWLALNGNPKSITVSTSLRKNATLTIDRFRMDYRYVVLK